MYNLIIYTQREASLINNLCTIHQLTPVKSYFLVLSTKNCVCKIVREDPYRYKTGFNKLNLM